MQQDESTLLLNLQNQLNLEREETKKSQQFMSAHKLAPHHPSHQTLARMAKALSFHITIDIESQK
jgi:hypothetical protein